jgi:hypothetical protein
VSPLLHGALVCVGITGAVVLTAGVGCMVLAVLSRGKQAPSFPPPARAGFDAETEAAISQAPAVVHEPRPVGPSLAGVPAPRDELAARRAARGYAKGRA